MIVVKVELHSAITGRVSEIGSMRITNRGDGSTRRGNYLVEVMRRGTRDRVVRSAVVLDYPRRSYPVWELIRRGLQQCMVDRRPRKTGASSSVTS